MLVETEVVLGQGKQYHLIERVSVLVAMMTKVMGRITIKRLLPHTM